MESSSSVSGWVVTVVTLSAEVLSVTTVTDGVVVVAGLLEEVEELVLEKVGKVVVVVVVEVAVVVVVVVVVVKRPTVKERLSLAPEPFLPTKTYFSISQVQVPASLASKPEI